MATAKKTATKKSPKAKPAASKPKAPAKKISYEEAIITKKAKETILQIEQWVLKNSDFSIVMYSNWFIGMADTDTTTGGLKYLLNADAGSDGIASAIETYFHKKGMTISEYKGNKGDNARHIYIHKNKG